MRLERNGHVGVLVLDRPPANAYDYDTLKQFEALIDDARYDSRIQAVVVASAPERFFCAGADISAFRDASPRQRAMISLLGHEVFRKIEQTPMVFVAAITGHASGGGLELALACDQRFAARGSYRLGLTETNLGLFPGNGGTQRLPRLVGLAKGIDMIATAQSVSPEDAYELGLIDRLYDDPSACYTAAIEYCDALAQGATEAIGRAKIAINFGYGTPLDIGLALERASIAHIFATHDADEGIRAFSEKRPPQFTGR
ncbi:MAG: enoyl-CoA hydratase/isomerase family protein [Acidimicrobiales bacterium]